MLIPTPRWNGSGFSEGVAVAVPRGRGGSLEAINKALVNIPRERVRLDGSTSAGIRSISDAEMTRGGDM
jgi:hypothetical protein